MIRTILIDDESNAIKSLESEIQKNFSDVDIVDICTSPMQGYHSILKHQPDLVFLDVDMPEMSGFDLLNKFDNINFNVIFCTGFSKYAINAFDISKEVVHYITKPIQIEKLSESIRRVREKPTIGLPKEDLQFVEANVYDTTKLPLSSNKGTEIIDLKETIYFRSEGHCIFVHMKDKKSPFVTTTTTLSKIEQIIPPKNFCRIDQSAIINIDFLSNFNTTQQNVTMSNNDIVKVSRSGKVLLKEKLKQF